MARYSIRKDWPLGLSGKEYISEKQYHQRADLFIYDICLDLDFDEMPLAPFPYILPAESWARHGLLPNDTIYFRNLPTGHFGALQVIQSFLHEMQHLACKYLKPEIWFDPEYFNQRTREEMKKGKEEIDAMCASYGLDRKDLAVMQRFVPIIVHCKPKAKWRDAA